MRRGGPNGQVTRVKRQQAHNEDHGDPHRKTGLKLRFEKKASIWREPFERKINMYRFSTFINGHYNNYHHPAHTKLSELQSTIRYVFSIELTIDGKFMSLSSML